MPKARRLLTGETLSVKDFADRIKDLTAMAMMLTKLHREEHDLSVYWRQAGELKENLPDADQKVAAQSLKKKLVAIRHWLWSGDTPEEIDETKSLSDARDTIGELWSSFPAPEPITLELLYAMPDLALVTGPGPGPEPDAAEPAVRLRQLPQPAEVAPRTEMTAGEAARVIKGARKRQWVVLAVSAFIAVLSGLTLLYVGKSWGTWWDYLAAFAWGLGTQAAVQSLASAIDGLGPLGALRHGIGAHSKPPAQA